MTTALFDIETTGLNAYTDRITCIGIIIDETGEEIIVMDQDEKQLLLNFLLAVEDKGIQDIIAYNGYKFDFPFMQVRVLKHDLQEQYDKIMQDVLCIDIKEELLESSFPSSASPYPVYRKPSLEEAASFFDIPLKKTGDGKQAVIMWQEQKIDALKEYCLNDVKILRAIFHKMEKSHSQQEKQSKIKTKELNLNEKPRTTKTH